MSEVQKDLPNTEASPWYSVAWVWLLLCIPFSAVVFGIVMIVSANYQPDDLVVDDYYREGMGINRRLQLDENAAIVGARVSLRGVTDEGAVFHVTQGSELLNLTLFHVSDRSRDIKGLLDAEGGGIYTFQSPEFARKLNNPGIWYIEIRDPKNQWRLRQRINTPLDQLEMSG